MMYWSDGWGWGAWLGMGLMMVAFWGFIAFLVVFVVRSLGHPSQGPQPPAQGPWGTPTAEDQALRILDERFARGDIDAEEYTRRRDLLRSR